MPFIGGQFQSQSRTSAQPNSTLNVTLTQPKHHGGLEVGRGGLGAPQRVLVMFFENKTVAEKKGQPRNLDQLIRPTTCRKKKCPAELQYFTASPYATRPHGRGYIFTTCGSTGAVTDCTTWFCGVKIVCSPHKTSHYILEHSEKFPGGRG